MAENSAEKIKTHSKKDLTNHKTELEILTFVVAIVVILSLIPILYCGLFNYATADDFIKSYKVHDVIQSGGSLLAVIKAGIEAAADAWWTWEGTWFSDFVLATQPSIWGEHVYMITVPLCIIYTFAGTRVMLQEILVQQLGLDKRAFKILFWMQLFLFLQYMPYIRGGMFWYTGMAHYIMPMCFSLLMIAWMFKWFRTKQKKYLICMMIFAVYIGGSHYQHIILVLIVYFFGWLWNLIHSREKRIHLIWIPIAEIVAGFILCILSPGNAVRGGESFGFHPAAVLAMPVVCIVSASQHLLEYVRTVPLLDVYLIIVFLFGWKYMKTARGAAAALRMPQRILVLVYLYLLYASTEAPGLYANLSDNTAGISGGYYDIIYQTFILTSTIGAALIGAWLREWRDQKAVQTHSVYEHGKKHFNICKLALTVLIIGLSIAALKPAVKNSGAYLCYTFASSGRLKDFVIQMEERISLMNDDNLKDVYVPEMNDDQGPFMHLQLSEDPDNYTNQASAAFYHKDSVTAVPREEYYEKYAEAQGHDIPDEYKDLYSTQ